MFESLRTDGGDGIRGLWQRLRPGAFATGLARLLQSLRFADGQGQLWPLRVLTPDERLSKPIKAAGCSVVVEEARAGSSAGLAADALCLLLHDRTTLDSLVGQVERVRSGGMIVLCSRPGRLPRQLLTAAFLHAGLSEIVQMPAGPYLLTAGLVLPKY